jgi:SAM-dependent methyltransferase
MAPVSPIMYTELAPWFHLLTPPDEYDDDAANILSILEASVDGPLETALELGSGGGNVASHLRRTLRLTLSDLSPAMLDLSRTINPGVEHVQGDMRTLVLDRTFDAVVVHDAIGYMATEADLRAAIATAYLHLRPGGAAVFLPDFVRDSFTSSTEHGGVDEASSGSVGRGLRYLEWSWDPDPDDDTVQTDYAIVLRDRDGTITVHHDRHIEGLFPIATWIHILDEAGFEPSSRPDEAGRTFFVGRRPA